MEHQKKGNKESSCIDCILFETLECEPFGSFVFYIDLNQTYNAKNIYNSLNSPNNFADASRGNIGLKGIATKMMNLVQFISWVLVKDTSLCLCATKESMKFYERLGFEEYQIQTNADFNVQERIAQSL